MKVLCDVHIAKKVVRFFKEKGIEAIHINDILDSWHTKDSKIADYADDEEYTVMSKDSDFKNSHLLKQSPRRLLMIRLGNISTPKLINILDNNLELLIEKFGSNTCYIEISVDSIMIMEM